MTRFSDAIKVQRQLDTVSSNTDPKGNSIILVQVFLHFIKILLNLHIIKQCNPYDSLLKGVHLNLNVCAEDNTIYIYLYRFLTIL